PPRQLDLPLVLIIDGDRVPGGIDRLQPNSLPPRACGFEVAGRVQVREPTQVDVRPRRQRGQLARLAPASPARTVIFRMRLRREEIARPVHGGFRLTAAPS